MPLDFYCLAGSPPCAAVKVAAKIAGVELKPIKVDLWKSEHLTPEYLAINPLHTVPVVKDGDLNLIESRAILTYLIDQYAKDSSYYPKDPKQRVLVDQKLYFDLAVLYARLADYYYPTLFNGAPEDPAKFEKIGEALKVLETFLEGSKFAAGRNPTLADVTLAITVSTYEALGHDLTPYKKVLAWYETCQTVIPGFAAIAVQSQKEFKDAIEFMKKK